MKKALVLASGLSLALLTTSCGTSAMQNSGRPVVYDVKDRKPSRPQIRRNPDPTEYDVTMTIENAPGAFGFVGAAMQYEVLDERCLPDLGGMSGTRASLLEWVPVELEQGSDGVYRGRVYDGLLVDEDYYGLGVCHWSLVAVQFKLKAGVSEADSVFSHHIFHDDLIGKDHVRLHFWKGFYPRGNVERLPVSGGEDVSKFKPEVRDELFVLDFKVRKAGA